MKILRVCSVLALATIAVATGCTKNESQNSKDAPRIAVTAKTSFAPEEIAWLGGAWKGQGQTAYGQFDFQIDAKNETFVRDAHFKSDSVICNYRLAGKLEIRPADNSGLTLEMTADNYDEIENSSNSARCGKFITRLNKHLVRPQKGPKRHFALNIRKLSDDAFEDVDSGIKYYRALMTTPVGGDAIFKRNTGVFYSTPELIENDRGLICVGYSKDECADAKFTVTSSYPSKNGSIYYDLEYTIAKHHCEAKVGKYMAQSGLWATLELKSGLNCADQP